MEATDCRLFHVQRHMRRSKNFGIVWSNKFDSSYVGSIFTVAVKYQILVKYNRIWGYTSLSSFFFGRWRKGVKSHVNFEVLSIGVSGVNCFRMNYINSRKFLMVTSLLYNLYIIMKTQCRVRFWPIMLPLVLNQCWSWISMFIRVELKGLTCVWVEVPCGEKVNKLRN